MYEGVLGIGLNPILVYELSYLVLFWSLKLSNILCQPLSFQMISINQVNKQKLSTRSLYYK